MSPPALGVVVIPQPRVVGGLKVFVQVPRCQSSPINAGTRKKLEIPGILKKMPRIKAKGSAGEDRMKRSWWARLGRIKPGEAEPGNA